jgi:multidrug efflux pump subunit AcrB
VIADMAGRNESPVYAILALRKDIQRLAKESDYEVKESFSRQPRSSFEQALKWDGKWQITYEVFRDLGATFLFALILIYVLVVGWFRSFTIPLMVMVPIPLTLVGILPAHWLMSVLTNGGGFFTVTSMIGCIAGTGIILFDPIFQGLAVALIAGEIATTLLSRMAVPILYYMLTRRHHSSHKA